jgi:hypothetical protein
MSETGLREGLLMDSRYKFPMLCSSLHTTTIIQLIIFVFLSVLSHYVPLKKGKTERKTKIM